MKLWAVFYTFQGQMCSSRMQIEFKDVLAHGWLWWVTWPPGPDSGGRRR